VIARAPALAALLALAACQTLPPRADLRPAAAAWPRLAAIGSWRARGRVAVRSATEGFSASFDWRESAGRSELDVRGPLGAGAAHITRTADTIRIDTGSAAPIDVAAPFERLEAELTARLGFPLPIEPLRYWMLGAPAPDRPSTATPTGFEQDGWAITLASFAPVSSAPVPLPSRLTLVRAGTQIKVAVSDWAVGAP
jgi:outer membrane lipoprotein LolB